MKSSVTFKFTKSWRKIQRIFLRMIGEYGLLTGIIYHRYTLNPYFPDLELYKRSPFSTNLYNLYFVNKVKVIY